MNYCDFWRKLSIAPNSGQIRDAAIRRIFPTVFERGWMRCERVNPVRLLLDMFAYREARDNSDKQKLMALFALIAAFIAAVAVLSLPPYSIGDMGRGYFSGKVVAICVLVLLGVQSIQTLRRPIALMPRDADFETAITFCYELHHFLTDLPEAVISRFWEGGLNDEMIREEAAKVLTAKVRAMLAAKKETGKVWIPQIVINIGESHLKSKFDSYKRFGLLGQDETYRRFYRRAQREAKALHVAQA